METKKNQKTNFNYSDPFNYSDRILWILAAIQYQPRIERTSYAGSIYTWCICNFLFPHYL